MSTLERLPRVVALGTYDIGKPRTRILLRGLRENGIQVLECHRDVWRSIDDKSQVRGVLPKLRLVWRLLSAYPLLVWRYLLLPKHDVVLIGYLGLFDVLVLWPFVRIRGAVLVWDVFLSLYNTVVEDRAMVGRYNPVALALWGMEWTAIRLVDLALMDTEVHADYLRVNYGCAPDKLMRVFVGAEPETFDLNARGMTPVDPDVTPKQVLFYGQFIPLHGIDTVVRAAKLTEDEGIRWILIGKGQESEKINALVQELQPINLEWIEWVKYEDLIEYLAKSHVALGIFGTTDKASRVIPNKVFQILLAGRPLVTADTPAARELLENSLCVRLVPAGTPQALADAVRKLISSAQRACRSEKILQTIQPERIGAELLAAVSVCCAKRNNG
jgi:glycosyltransferase involved in cell wall biosynthesis